MKYPDISKAVEQEILASYEKLYRLAFSYVKNEQDAMDVVQESVYKAMKNASQIKEKKYIKALISPYSDFHADNPQFRGLSTLQKLSA